MYCTITGRGYKGNGTPITWSFNMMSYKLNLRKDPEDIRDFPFLCSLNVQDLKNDVLTATINLGL